MKPYQIYFWTFVFTFCSFSFENVESKFVGFCPSSCSCYSDTVRCHKENLHIPRGIPTNTKKLYLSGSKIKYLKNVNLPNLTSLSLANTGLADIHSDSLKTCTKLERLDLSYNVLSKLTAKFLRSIINIKVLQVNNNAVVCVDPALKYLTNLEVLNLQNNKLKYLPSNAFMSMPNLRQLRLEQNLLDCSCGVEWLTKFLRQHPDLGIGILCHSPASHSGRSVSTVLPHQLICKEELEENACVEKSFVCPLKCKCSKGTVDCRSLGLTEVPSILPFDTLELRLEKNQITHLPSYAFASAPNLKRIDISRNKISEMAEETFKSNSKLTTLIFYDNELEVLPPGLFEGLHHLHMLLLNKNKLTCIPPHSFQDQKNLVLVSLFDNNLKGLPNNLFKPLENIKTLHLGLNPWDCNCELAWLSSFLNSRGIETSSAVCKTPEKLSGELISSRYANPCSSSSSSSSSSGYCNLKMDCPGGCICTKEKMDCTSGNLTIVPAVHSTVQHLILDNNALTSISDVCKQTPNLRSLSLRNNKVDRVLPGTFKDCRNLEELDLGGNQLVVLENQSFTGLQGVKTIDVTGNMLVCVSKNIFNDLKKLKKFRISTDFIPCTCNNMWLYTWLSKHTVFDETRKDCSLVCPPKEVPALESENECNLEMCPDKCSCKDRIVRCGGLNITNIPQYMSPLSKQLYLDSNMITEVKASSLLNQVNLKLIDLSNNLIEFIDSSSFPSLPQLETIILSYNRIRCISAASFTGLSGLKVLSLHDNNLSGLDRNAIGDIKQISHLAIGNNPLHCDCKLQWLSVWFKDGFEAGTAICSTPIYLENKPLINIPTYYFICKGGLDPVYNKCNPCYSAPCLNSGFCITDEKGDYSPSSTDFRCECTPSFHGDRCQYKMDACYGAPCRHGGNCTVLDKGRFKCNCTSGYEGRVCEKSIDECKNNKCQNNASCLDRVGDYTCICPEGFEGKYCENRDNRIQTSSRHSCSEHMCQNGGKCVNEIFPGQYTCKCPPSYSGRYCQIEPRISVMYQRSSPCAQHDCKHGLCQEDLLEPTYTCVCHPGYSGKLCEYLTTVQYRDQDSYIELDPLYTARPVNITLVIQTEQDNGVLLYHGDREHLAVELFHGRIRVSLDVGNFPVSTMFSYATLNDDLEHSVRIYLSGKSLALTVDGNQPRTVVNEGVKTELSVLAPTFIGGVPEPIGESALSFWHLRNSTSFKGCIKEFYIDDKLIDFLQAARKRHAVAAGCFTRQLGMPTSAYSVSQDKEIRMKKACLDNKCTVKGTKKCSAKRKQDYVCKCKKGYAGRYCEKAPTCRKRKQRRVLEENNCKSRKPVSLKRCKGDCHDGTCCKAKNSKTRKIGMICNDGTRYVKVITTATKCSCGERKNCYASDDK